MRGARCLSGSPCDHPLSRPPRAANTAGGASMLRRSTGALRHANFSRVWHGLGRAFHTSMTDMTKPCRQFPERPAYAAPAESQSPTPAEHLPGAHTRPCIGPWPGTHGPALPGLAPEPTALSAFQTCVGIVQAAGPASRQTSVRHEHRHAARPVLHCFATTALRPLPVSHRPSVPSHHSMKCAVGDVTADLRVPSSTVQAAELAEHSISSTALKTTKCLHME